MMASGMISPVGGIGGYGMSGCENRRSSKIPAGRE